MQATQVKRGKRYDYCGNIVTANSEPRAVVGGAVVDVSWNDGTFMRSGTVNVATLTEAEIRTRYTDSGCPSPLRSSRAGRSWGSL